MSETQKILVVDDQTQNVELLEAYLAPIGYEVVTATSGLEALGKIKDCSPDLVLSDVMMPGMDGFELTRKIKQDALLCHIPVVLVTALRETEDRVKGIDAGCDDFISKPVDKLELLARVKSLLKVKLYNDLKNAYQGELEAEVSAKTVELKLAFEEQESLQRQLFQSQKMEAIGRLAGGVAHDFNNILQVIQGFADHLIAKTPADDPRLAWIKQIRVASDKANVLVQSLLTFSRKQAQNKATMSMNAVIKGMEPMLQQVVGKSVKLELALAPDLEDLVADRNQVEMIMMNLTTNARDAMGAEGTLTLSSADAEIDSVAYVLLSIRDTGSGMDAQTMEHIFEPFFTTKEIGKGTGLGLATVYGVVKQAGGLLQCDSALGEGTEFRIYLPRGDGARV